MSYVILRPNSNTNSSDKFRVVDYDSWNDFIARGNAGYMCAGEFKTYAEAETLRDELNKAEAQS